MKGEYLVEVLDYCFHRSTLMFIIQDSNKTYAGIDVGVEMLHIRRKVSYLIRH